MTPGATYKGDKVYRYYVNTASMKIGKEACSVSRVPAGEIEAAVIAQVRKVLQAPEVMSQAIREVVALDPAADAQQVITTLQSIEPVWDELFPAEQARIMVDAGAECVYVVDSAGALVLGDAQVRVQAVIDEIGHQAQVGFHGHQNLSMGVANSVLAYQAGARQVDGALLALGAGAGNSPTEVLAATFERLGVPTGVDVQGALAAAEDIVKPMVSRLPHMDRSSIVQGYAGVYSSFLLHAERAGQRYGVPAHEILQRVGEAGYVGGQEDMIIDIALQLAEERDLGDPAGVGTR